MACSASRNQLSTLRWSTGAVKLFPNTMTSTSNPLQDFVLTPQQQNLLFAALNSNKAVANPPINNVLNMSPSTLNESPLPTNDTSGIQESPLLDYDFSFDGAEPGFDFTFDDGSQPRMIGDLPGDGDDSREDSASADNENSDKRSHPDDDDEEPGANKRRESTEKVPKKPGRKPLTSEPSSVCNPKPFTPGALQSTNIVPL